MPTSSAPPAAQAQAAAHRTALLLDHCRYHLLASATPQARWHAAQQILFLAWLQAGGFAQTEATKENSDMTSPFSVPQKDLYEELKFSLLRIDDAVE